jgi:hypothetical protein
MAKEILKISSDEYFALPKLSNSAIKDFRNEGSWTYYHRYVANSLDKPKESDAMRIGSALHSIINVDAFSSSSQPIAVMPEWVDLGGIQPEKLNLRKKAHREFKQEFVDRNAGKIILTPREYEQVVGMRDSIWDNPAIRPYLEQLTADRSEVVVTNKVNGVDCKAMCDADFSDQSLIIDFKTTRQSLGKEFVKDCLWKYGYQYQAAHYCDVMEAKRFLFVAVRNFQPYESVLFEMPEDFIGQARLINHQTIDRIKWCQEMDEWHSDEWGQVINMEDVISND